MFNSITKKFQWTAAIVLTLLLFIFSQALHAAEIDPAFNPSITKDMTSNYTGGMIAQPDGKLIIFGRFETGGTYLSRLNADGTNDLSFNCAICTSINVSNAQLLPGGKIIVAGFSDVPKLYRLNADGSHDATFNATITPGVGNVYALDVMAVQPDGKVFVYKVSNGSPGTLHEIIRYNTDGSRDESFLPFYYGPFRFSQISYSRLQVLPDGKLLIGGTQTSAFPWTGFISRRNADGSADPTFEAPTFGDSSDNRTSVGYFDALPDGSIIVPGKFATVNSVSKIDLVKLTPAGNVDLTFNPDSFLADPGIVASKATVLPNGQFLLSTGVWNAGIPASGENRLLRFNSNGSLDNTFNTPVGLSVVQNYIVDSSNKIPVFGILSGALRFLRLNSDATLDPGFNPVVTKKGIVSALAVQPDGKILASGDFNRVAGTVKNNFARLNADGTLDPSFDAGSGFDVAPKLLAVQADGKVLAIGTFTTYNGVARTKIARLNPDGSLDAAFAPAFESSADLNAVVPLADGKILIGGWFAAVNGIAQSGVARLNGDGSVDTLFAPIFGGNPYISALIVQPDGKIMVAGSFNGANGFNRQNLVRLNADGALDSSFNAGSIQQVNRILRQPDGKYIVQTGSNDGPVISRRNTDGSADASFTSPAISGTINTMFVQADGGILVGGAFWSPRANLARFLPNGSLDETFLPTGSNNAVHTLAAHADGKVLVGGNFITVGGVPRSGMARISFATVVQPRKYFDFDGDGKADVSVFRPSENKWYVLRSSDLGVTQQVWGIAGDVPAPADYDGDGKTDFAIFRPGSGDWWSLSSLNGAQIFAHWGANGDVPRPSDFDGDGRADYVVFRPSDNFWYRISSANGASSNAAFGLAGDKPVTGDFDGDGKSDKAIFRPSSGDWWYQSSINGAQLAVHWGISTDVPAPADFDGDGKTDFCVYRPSTGTWYIINSNNGSFTIMNFGITEDKPVPADYDGDGKADIAVFRPSSGGWYLQRSTAGFWALNWGISTDIPVENAFVP